MISENSKITDASSHIAIEPVMMSTSKDSINRPQLAIEMMLGVVNTKLGWLYEKATKLLGDADANQYQPIFEIVNVVELCFKEVERVISNKHDDYDSFMEDIVYLDSMVRMISKHCLTDGSSCKTAVLKIIEVLDVAYVLIEIESEAVAIQ